MLTSVYRTCWFVWLKLGRKNSRVRYSKEIPRVPLQATIAASSTEKINEIDRYGYEYLIEPMMKSGGYVAASERMGIDLNARTLKDNEYYERINPTVGLDLQKKANKDGFLTLGR